jgi:hypothetical protein
MFPRVIAHLVVLMTAGLGSPSGAGSSQVPSPWQRTESARFEIHYEPSLARELERVSASAERAYDRISGRLSFVLGTKVPLVLFAPAGSLTREQVVAYATSEHVAPHRPHRGRIVLPLAGAGAQLDALIVHELTHILVGEIILPSAPGDGGVPRWVLEGIASYMVGAWSEDHERVMRELVASDVPDLSQLTGSGQFANVRVNDILGHAAFDYIESRWGVAGVRRFVNALNIPRVNRTYDAVFELTPAEFDAAFRQYAERRFRPVAR